MPEEKAYDWDGNEVEPDFEFTVRLNEFQQKIIEKYPKLKEHLINHIKQDVNYYFNEYLRKDLSDAEKVELGLLKSVNLPYLPLAIDEKYHCLKCNKQLDLTHDEILYGGSCTCGHTFREELKDWRKPLDNN